MSRSGYRRTRFQPPAIAQRPPPANDLLEQRHLDYLCGVPFHKPVELLSGAEPSAVKGPGLAIDQRARKQEAQRLAQQETLRVTLQQRVTAQTEAELCRLVQSDGGSLHRHLPINPKLSQALALLALDAPSSQLAFQIRQTSWLSRELLAMVNSPVFRLSSGVHGAVSDLSHALACFGKERLRALLARYLCQQMLPEDARPFVGASRRLWQYLSIKANTAACLAELQGLDPFIASRQAWNDSYGALALLRLLKQIFLGFCEHHMQQARLASQPQVHQLLSELDMPASTLKRLLPQYQFVLSQRLLVHLSPQCKFSITSLAEVNAKLPWRLTSPYSRVVIRADGYAKYYNLNEQRRILPAEAVKLMAQYAFSGDDLLELHRQNLKKSRF